MIFLLLSISKEILLEAEVSKLVVRLVRLYSQNERETDGAVHWKIDGSKTASSISESWRTQILGL